MSFVTAQSPALTAAATKLQHLGTAMAAQNTAMAAPTTNVAPAAADGVSALQALQFSAYGTWYQQVSQQAEAVHQMLVNTLGSNAGAYGDTEATNQATTGSNSLTGLLNSLTGGASPAAPGDTGISSSSGAGLATAFNGLQNFGAASSDMFDLSQGQYAPEAQAAADSSGLAGGGAAVAVPATTGTAGAVTPMGGAGLGALPVTAGVGQASSIGKLSVPPAWTVSEVGAASPVPTTSPAAGWTSPAPHAGQVNTMPAGVPSVASGGRSGLGVGAPRYGVKHTVMPKPTVV
ncbi:PE domain-containing protein [Candidatus Mycobacterium wuenschmannii]|uniref:PE domain-containing protein n=1 Tax=Candidatus Mycobacterium wuenschmannii TaxID=3027808 RepID=A0ABY8W210_9MYCO|nr:PE domain-containing protein [Candidatus Mycobacterium wuenschmannii]WIM89913.1 PE domain-containing protein [Candidatus Mycobacterium wuenschmannii]